jgi:hypothetical protein
MQLMAPARRFNKRCTASDSYMLEIISNVISEGGSLSGSWAEATRGQTRWP